MYQKKVLSQLAFLCSVFVLLGVTASAQEPLQIHNPNLFILAEDKEVFYPRGINATFLLNLDYPNEKIEDQFKKWAEVEANTIRLVIDDFLVASGDSYQSIHTNNGMVKEEFLARIDTLFGLAQQHDMRVLLCFFDTLSMAEHWQQHSLNKSQGGPCANLQDFFVRPSLLKRAQNKVDQLISRYEDRALFALELARGVNVWDIPKIKNKSDFPKRVEFWVFRIADHIRRTHDKKHLLALSYTPNTMPVTLIGASYIDINLLHIQARDPKLTAYTVPNLIQMGRSNKKPIFIAETTWKGPSAQRQEFFHNIFWASMALNSCTFVTPTQNSIADADLATLKTALPFITYTEFDGHARPPSKVDIALHPKGSYFVVDQVVGNDWIFWILRKDPGEASVQMHLRTVEGQYEYNWFSTDEFDLGKRKAFQLLRKELTLQTPPFAHDIIGVLRLKERITNETTSKKSPPQTTQPKN